MNNKIIEKIGVYRSNGAIDISIIEDFEVKFNIHFPNSYKELISEFDKLYPKRNLFNFAYENGEDTRDIVFLSYSRSNSENINDFQSHDIYGYAQVIAVGISANGDYLCFDYRENQNTDNPSVILMFHDDYIIDEYGNNKLAFIKVANSFDDFIDILYE